MSCIFFFDRYFRFFLRIYFITIRQSEYFCVGLWEKVKKKVDTRIEFNGPMTLAETRPVKSDAVDNNFIVLLFIYGM